MDVEVLGELMSLQQLALRGCCIQSAPLPSRFCQLTNLKKLDIRDNQVTLIPSAMAPIIRELDREGAVSNLLDGNHR